MKKVIIIREILAKVPFAYLWNLLLSRISTFYQVYTQREYVIVVIRFIWLVWFVKMTLDGKDDIVVVWFVNKTLDGKEDIVVVWLVNKTLDGKDDIVVVWLVKGTLDGKEEIVVVRIVWFVRPTLGQYWSAIIIFVIEMKS